MPKITWDDIAKLDGDSPFKKISEGINQVAADLEHMLSVTKSVIEKFNAELEATQKEGADLAASVKKMNLELEGSGKALQEASQKSTELNANAAKTKTAIDENTKSYKALDDQLKTVNKTKEQANKNTIDEAGSLNDIKTKLSEAEKAYRAAGEAADTLVKKELLDNIKDLSKQQTLLTQTLSDAKKGIVVAAGSYVELNRRVIEGKKELKNMADGIEGNSAKFKALQKEVKEGTEQLKKFDNEIGDHQREVGNYKEQIEALIPALKGISGEFAEAGEKGLGFLETIKGLGESGIAIGLGVGLAALAAIFEVLKTSVEKYFKETIEGSDKLNEITGEYNAVLETVDEQFIQIGKHLADLLPGAGLFNLAIQKSVDILNHLPGGGGAVAFLKQVQERLVVNTKLSEAQNEIKKEEIRLLVEQSELELEFSKELFDSRDKVNKQAQERYDALRAANDISDEITKNTVKGIDSEIEAQRLLIKSKYLGLQADQSSLDLLEDKNAIDKIGYEDVEKLAQLEAKRNLAQRDAFDQAKIRQKQEIQFVRDQQAIQVNSEKAIRDAVVQGRTEALNEVIASNKRKLENDAYTVQQQVDAALSTTEALLDLDKEAEKTQVRNALDAATQIKELTAKQSEEIFGNKELSLNQQVALDLKYRTQSVLQDKNFIKQREEIEQAHEDKQKEIIRSGGDEIAKIAFVNAQKLLKAEQVNNAQETSGKAQGLNEQFNEGIVNLKQYNIEKYNLERDAKQSELALQLEELQATRDFFANRKELAKTFGIDINAINKSIALTEKAISDESIKERIEAEKKAKEILLSVRQEIFAATGQILSNQAEASKATYDQQIKDLETERDSEIEIATDKGSKTVGIAGDNAEAKIAIDKYYNKQIKSLQDAARADANRQAIYQKALTVLQIGTNTASAVVAALAPPPIGLGPVAGLPYSILIGAVGALQLAGVLTKPVPQYAKGIDSSPATWAVVNDGGGSELITDKKGKARMYDTPGAVLTYLEAGSKVHTAEETRKIMQGTNYLASSGAFSNGVNIIRSKSDDSVRQTLRSGFGKLERTINRKKEFHLNITKEGISYWMKQGDNWTKFLNDNYR